jgi:acetyltransferase/esterase
VEANVDLPPEPSADLPAPVRDMLIRMQANMETCLAYELRSFVRFRPDLEALRDAWVIPAVGADTGKTFAYRVSAAIADSLGTEVVEFPGGHVGWLMRHAEFATTLHEVLDR